MEEGTIMSACSPLSFTGLTPGVVTCLVNLANQYGANIPDPPPPSGEKSVSTSFGSFTFTWSFDTANQTGTIACTDSPTLMPCFVINGAASHAVQNCGGNPA